MKIIKTIIGCILGIANTFILIAVIIPAISNRHNQTCNS